jgi:PAS domain S-box-containing protein
MLRASEERLRLALEATGTGTFLWHADSDRVEANAQLLKLCDLPADVTPTLRAAIRERIHPEDLARYDESWALAMDPAGSGVFRNEFRVMHGNGEVRWIVFAGQIFFEGVPPHAVGSVGTAADITERKRADQILVATARRSAFRVALGDALRPLATPTEVRRTACRVLNHHLGATRTLYVEWDPSGAQSIVADDPTDGGPSVEGRHLLQNAGDGVLEPLREGRVVVVNDLDCDDRHDPSARRVRADDFARAYIGVPLVKEGRLAACLVVQQSSRRAWTTEEVMLVEEAADRTWAAVARARAEQELREADRRKDEFLAILGHELRNPLAPLRNALEVMKVAPDDGKLLAQSRDIMSRQLTQMVRLIDDLLDVSRIGRGKLELRRERIGLHQIIRQAVETSRPLIDAGCLHLTVKFSEEPLIVEADPSRLGQVFANLLNNAAKYNEPGGEIILSAEKQGERAVIRVRDTGIGIPREMLARVFEMFLQADRSLEKAQGGLGVGLSLVKGLVELHHGVVEAHSEGPGRGSEFVVQLPLAPALTAKPLRGTRKELVAATGRRRILVVDDNRDSASSLAMVLDALKYETRVAFDGMEAIETASEFRPHIVLLDIGMPRLNGYDACRRMRKKAWGRNMVIVALTGWGRLPDQDRSKAAGFDFHLVKPVDPALLSRLLTTLPPSPAAVERRAVAP